jgi:hypothetical protein
MHVRVLSAVALASALALAACGGGGGGGTSPAPAAAAMPPVPTAAPVAPAATGSVLMSISIPRRNPSGSARSPQFISPSASAIAIYDGATLVYVANLNLDSQTPFNTIYAKSGNTTVTPGTCTFGNTATCTLSITATVGAHTFDLLMYPQLQGSQATSASRKPSDTGTPPTFAGVISSEGELAVTIVVGTNPAATVTLLGVADQAVFAGTTEAAYNATATFGYRIQDSTSAQIIQPGTAYDNGPVTITANTPGIVTITPSSVSTPPTSVGDQSFNVQCVNTAGGTVTITIGAKTHPNTAYVDGLTYTSSNYSNGTLTSFSFTCDAATATIPITVDGKGRR